MLRRDRVQIGLVILGAMVLVLYPLIYRLTSEGDAVAQASNKPATGVDESPGSSLGASPATSPTPARSEGPSIGTSWVAEATRHRGANGQTFGYVCPPDGVYYTVWGTDVYTDDSSVCTAAVHRGVIDREAGGPVSVVIRPGRPSYVGSTRCDVTTDSYGSWGGSYEVVIPRTATPLPCAAASAPTLVPSDGPSAADPWLVTANGLRGLIDERFEHGCPAGGPLGDVWGTDTYTDDSAICTAAVHAGAITLETGGTVEIDIRPGLDTYVGSTRNRVTTQDHGPFEGSVVIIIP